jgi:hypothetical protein
MSTNSQIAFNPQENTVVVATDPTAPLGVQAPAATIYLTPGEGL